jgi:mandelamide amidase
LAGLPLIIKDNIDSASLPTTAASKAFEDWQPKEDAPVLASLLKAGSVMLGKANMHEMAFGVTSNNPVYGPVRNPYDTAMISGGSSGGTAAAIAARVVVGGLGSDTGGSCRIPAALSGCVGLRPTYGRYSSAGVIPLTWTRDTPGPLGRTVEDVILLDSVCAKRPAEIPLLSLSGARVAIPASFYEDLDSELAEVVDHALMELSRAGLVMVDEDIMGLQGDGADFRGYEGPRALSSYLFEHGSRMSVIDLVEKVAGPVERERLSSQLETGPTDVGLFIDSLVVDRPAHLTAVADYFKDYNVSAMIIPTTALPARPIGHDDMVELKGREVPTFSTYTRNTAFGSGMGLPCLSVPAGLTPSGLPVGMEFVGPAEGDGVVLALGREFEKIVGPLPPPPI